MSEYIYLTHPFREGFFEQPTPEETQIMEEHYLYLKNATTAGSVLLAGATLDETFSIIILSNMDETSAQTFMLNDPSVKKNVMMAELHPLRVTLRGK